MYVITPVKVHIAKQRHPNNLSAGAIAPPVFELELRVLYMEGRHVIYVCGKSTVDLRVACQIATILAGNINSSARL